MFNVDSVKKRLKMFGYETKADEEPVLVFCVYKIKNTIINDTNCKEVPEGLEHVAVDMTAGEFLLTIKTFTPDSLTSLDLDFAVKQIQTGDTNTVFAVGEACSTPEQRLNMFINYLLNYGKAEFASYRMIKW